MLKGYMVRESLGTPALNPSCSLPDNNLIFKFIVYDYEAPQTSVRPPPMLLFWRWICFYPARPANTSDHPTTNLRPWISANTAVTSEKVDVYKIDVARGRTGPCLPKFFWKYSRFVLWEAFFQTKYCSVIRLKSNILPPVAILEFKKLGEGALRGQEKSRGVNINVYLAWWSFVVLKIKLLWLTLSNPI